MEIIARIRTDFPTKFGIPRQSGLVPQLEGKIVFEPAFRREEALRGIEGFSHLWLIWQFSESVTQSFTPTVRPPRLGGNTRLGVFATRSPFRPNPIGLSCVRLVRVEKSETEGPTLIVAGADLMDGTPIYDIKPYLPYADCHPEATGGFAPAPESQTLRVEVPPSMMDLVPPEKREALLGVLGEDPRPGYRRGEDGRTYGVTFAGLNVRFTVADGTLTVREIRPAAGRP